MMKKLLVLLTLLIAGVLTMSAQHGYRGFADISLGAGFGDWSVGFSVALSTTHGYQCNGHIFVGGGVNIGYSSATYWNDYDHPSYFDLKPTAVFAALRYDYSLLSRRSFFYEIKVGPSITDAGILCSMGPGLRLGNSGKIAYNLGLKANISYHDTAGCPILPEAMLSFGIDF